NHLARLTVLAFGADDPVLSRLYAPHWIIVPNLALDVIGPPLLRLLPVHVAGRLLLAGAALLPVIGVVAYHRAVFGVRSYWPLAAAIVAFNGIFFLGFINLLYAVGLAFLAAALWIYLVDRRPLLTLVVSAVAATALFFCHLFGVLFFVLLVASHELAGWWEAPSLRRAMTRAGMILLTLAPALVLYRLSALSDADGLLRWSSPGRKLIDLLSPFLTYHQSMGLATAVAVLAAFILLWRHATLHAGSAIALGVLAVVFLIAPSAMKGGTFIDTRLPLLMVLLAFAGARPIIPRSTAIALGAAAAALLLVRTADMAAVWYGHRQDLAELRASIAPIEPGARVLVVSAAGAASQEYLADEPAGRIIPGLYRADVHMAALLLVDRHAFWPLLFADPRQQPVIVRPPYDAIARPLGEPPDYRRLAGDGMAAPDAPYLAGWPTKFDYVLLIDAGAVADPTSLEPRLLQLLNQSDMAALYRVRRSL
ncbi:MAG: hypothetical protein WD036_05290, partial [Bauldia sp.]